MKEPKYVHGYDETEQERLHKQATILSEMTYQHLSFNGVETLLEMGCGTGGQTEIILSKNESVKITAVDVSETQLAKAKQNLQAYSKRVTFINSDVSQLNLADNSFDAVFICWLLEHVTEPIAVLKEAFRLLKPNGKIFLTEVNNDSLQIIPKYKSVHRYMDAFNDLQIELGGDPFIGIMLGRILAEVGFSNIKKQSLHQLHDKGNPEAKATIVTYFKNLYLSAADGLLNSGKIDTELLSQMKTDLDALITNEDGVFYYSPIQATAQKLG